MLQLPPVLKKALPVILPLFIFSLCLFALYHLLSEYSFAQLKIELHKNSLQQILFALLLCICNFAVLTCYDFLSLQFAKAKLKCREIALTSGISYAFSQNLGFSFLSGAAVRMRLYGYFGLNNRTITKIILFCSLHFWAGFFLLGSIATLIKPSTVEKLLGLDSGWGTIFGSCLLSPIMFYLISSTRKERTIKLAGQSIEIPKLTLAIKALFVSTLDWILAASVFFVLLPQESHITFARTIIAFLIAQMVAVISHIPGGVGAFETVIISLLSTKAQSNTLLSTLFLFRVIYYFCPFVVALIAYLSFELKSKRSTVLKLVAIPLANFVVTLVPRFLSFAVFISGLILLLSGASPTAENRRWWVENVVSGTLLEVSHFSASLIGLAMLIVSWGLLRKLARAYHAAILLMLTGSLVSLLKGLDYEEAILLTVIGTLLYISKEAFYKRKDSLPWLTLEQLLLILVALASSIWLGFFSYKHVEYTNELWWQFEAMAEAPRFLRASVATSLALLVYSLYSYINQQPQLQQSPTQTELEEVRNLVPKAAFTEASLAYLGDKLFLFNQKRTGFIMYQRKGKSLIAMGDPVASDKETTEELIWRFYELADESSCYCVFYEVSAEHLPIYLDLGLTPLKLGEQAIVDLTNFTLEGATNKGLRHSLNKMTREGLSFEIIEAPLTEEILWQLRNVSDAWLSEKNSREKGFSLGFFTENYLRLTSCAVVRQGTKLIAFANLWRTLSKEELSVDLMRYLPGSPNGLMDYIFISLMQLGKTQGYKSFNLGMAPFSGLEARRLSPLWTKFGNYLYQDGEQFYNFEGLRKYKEKFHPKWQPRYLISESGMHLPVILYNISRLISGGVRGVLT